jgi:hypothetical protein
MPAKLPISKLTPAAARLLLALRTCDGQETWEEVIARSGIHACHTLAAAKQQLRDIGFIYDGPDGERVTMFARGAQTEPLGRSSLGRLIRRSE